VGKRLREGEVRVVLLEAKRTPLRQWVCVLKRCWRAMNQVGMPAGMVLSSNFIEISRQGSAERSMAFHFS
jgi:hypothetical protein